MGGIRPPPLLAKTALRTPLVTSRVVVFFLAALCLAGYVWVYAAGVQNLPIRSDGFSYYVYLPSWFLFHDTTLAEVAKDCCGGVFPEFTAIIRWPETRRWVNAHPIGVAVMQAPVFPLAHLLTTWTNLSPDGFSLYYQHAAGLAGLGWMVAGLAVLRKLLLRSFTDGVTAATLLALLLGTNLYHYGTFDSSYSHAYSSFLFATFMWLTARWYQDPTKRTSVLLGAVGGLIVLVRHTNVLFACVFLLHGLATRQDIRTRIDELVRARKLVILAAVTATVVIAPQLLIYYQATGRLIVSSYGELGFNWTTPQLAGVLFGVRKGLFFWSPLLLIATAGLVMLLRSRKPASAFVIPGVLFLAFHTYLVASWWDWQFGGSYGHRGFVDTLPIFALGLAAVFERASQHAIMRIALAVIVSLLTALSVFQMLQYWYGILPMSDLTWAEYRRLFLQWR